jgi:hypothetical protein
MSHRNRPKNEDSAILRAEREILHVEEEILRQLHKLNPHHQRTASISLQFSGDLIMNSLTLAVGQSSIGTIIPLLADGVTPSGGAVSNASFFIPPNPSFSAVDNADSTVTIVGLAVSAATVTGTASTTITDQDGAVSTFSQSFTIVVTAGTTPPPTATTASIGISFSTPTPVAA